MSSKRIKAKKPGGKDISRRQLLQSLGGGIAGGMLAGGFAKPAHATPITLNSSTTPVFDVLLPSGTSLIPGREANLINGMLFVRVLVNGTPDMQCFDVQSNQFAFSLSNLLPGGTESIPPTPFTDPRSDGMFVYTANQQILYQMDINGNALQTLPILSGATGSVITKVLINSNQDLLCWSDGATLVRFNIAAQQNVWPPIRITDALNTGIAPVIMVDGAVAYVYGNQIDGVHGGVFPVNLTTGSAVNPTAPIITIPKGTGASYAQGMLFVSGVNGVVTAHDAGTGNQLWQYPPDSSTLSGPLLPPVCNNNQVLVADAAGILHIISQSTGAGTPLPLGSAPTPSSRIYVEDNSAYLSLGPASNLTAFAIALDSPNNNAPNTASYATNSTGVFVGVQNGVCYFSHNNGQNLAARSFTSDLHGLFSESILIEDYVASSSGTVHTPSYRTHLQFLDSNYNPRIGKAIRVWASDTVQITSGQNTYTVDTDNGVWLTTDSAGELPIVVGPDNVTCPTLFVWNTYMLPGDAMMVYPDWDTTNSLANLQSSQMPATNPWDKSPLFSQVNGTDDIAQSIRSSMTGGSQASAVRAQVKQQIANNRAHKRTGHTTALRATSETSYIAYPSANPNMTFAPDYVNVLPTRAFVSSSPSPWTISFVNGTWTYTDGASSTPQAGLSFIKISFHDLLKKCVHDVTETLTKVEAAVDTVSKAITHTITTIANDVVNTYELAIDSLEAAAAVVSSILTSALKDIESAVKWLSYLFQWSTFVANGKTIADQVTSRLQTFASWAQNLTSDDLASIQGVFTDAENKISGFLSSFMSTTGGSSFQSHLVDNNNPQTAYGAGGAQSYSQTKWFSSKVQANMGQATVTSTVSARAAVDDPYTDLANQFENLLSSFGDKLAQSEFTHIPGDIKTLFESVLTLFTNPSNFVTKTFNSILQLLTDILVGFVQFVAAVIESILQAIPIILNAVVALLTTPLSIPLIGDIWKAIDNGNPLTIVNVVGLAVAIPATIVSKVIPSTSQGVGSDSYLNLALLFAGLTYTAVDSFSDLENVSSTGLTAWLGLTLSAFTWSSSFAFANAPTDFYQGIYYPLTAVPLMISGLSIGINSALGIAAQTLWGNVVQPSMNLFYGVLMIPFTLYVAGSSSFLSTLGTLANIIGSLPYIGKITATGPAFQFPENPQRAVAAAVDLLGDAGSVIINYFGNAG